MITPIDESSLVHGMNTAWLQSHVGYGEAQERIAELEAQRGDLVVQLHDLCAWMLTEHVRLYGVEGQRVAEAITQILENLENVDD